MDPVNAYSKWDVSFDRDGDGISEDGDLNKYAYTGSSPISWTDPTGLAKKKIKELTLGRQRQEKSSWQVDGVRVSASFAEFVARSVQGGREARAWRVQRDAPELAEKMKAAAKQLDAQAAASEGEDAEKSRALADTLRQGATLLEGMAEAAAQGPEMLERFGQENADALQDAGRRLTEATESRKKMLLTVDLSASTLAVTNPDGSTEVLPAATGDGLSFSGADAEGSGKVVGTAWGPVSDRWENAGESWSEDGNQRNPFGPAIIIVEGTDNRHIHGTNGPMDGGVEYIGGEDPMDRKVTHGCVRLLNRDIVRLKRLVDGVLEDGGAVDVRFIKGEWE